MIQPPTSEFESGAIGMVRCFNTFAATGRRQLLVKGDAGDVLDLDDGAGTTGWTPSGTQVIHAVTYNTWNHDTSLATLYVAQSVSVIWVQHVASPNAKCLRFDHQPLNRDQVDITRSPLMTW